jgi:coenzyme F420-reducing hydrogenase delta subunit
MCSGRVDPAFAVEALRGGIDGVAILGCHLNDCHYISGNYEEQNKFKMLDRLLEHIGFNNRVMLDWVSAAEGVRFSKIITEFTEKIKNVGPNPLKEIEGNEDLIDKIDAAARVVNDPRIRTLIGREYRITTQENVYGKKVDEEFYDQILDEAIIDEFNCQRMLIAMEKEPLSVKAMAEKLDIKSKKVLQYVTKLRGKGLIDLDKIVEVTPIYKSIQV